MFTRAAFLSPLVLVAFTACGKMDPQECKKLRDSAFELINSAIEAVVDRVSLDRNPLSKNAKDLGSAAVMLSFVFALATWGAILLPLLR